jgi:hypothetical protein
MMVQVPVSTAIPAALAVGSISLSLSLLPAGAASVRASGVAPALRLVAGEVVAAAKNPTPAHRRVHRERTHVFTPPRVTPPPTPLTHVSAPASSQSTPVHEKQTARTLEARPQPQAHVRPTHTQHHGKPDWAAKGAAKASAKKHSWGHRGGKR